MDTRDNVGVCRECHCFIYRGLHSVFRNICAFFFNYPGEKKSLFSELEQVKKGSLHVLVKCFCITDGISTSCQTKQ